MATSPRPWSFKPPHSNPTPHDTDEGVFLDANGDVVCHFGDSEMYYPTEGRAPSDDDVALILKAVNEYVEP